MASTTTYLLGGAALLAIVAGGYYVYSQQAHSNPIFPGSSGPEQLPHGFSPYPPRPRPRKTPKRHVAFKARLSVNPVYDTVIPVSDSEAILYRDRVAVIKFRPATYQRRKIRDGAGDILIYVDQIVESLIAH